MSEIYSNILGAIEAEQKLLAVLIDPDKKSSHDVAEVCCHIDASIATHIFIGGSIVNEGDTEIITKEIKRHTSLPIVLFPGNTSQITKHADAILFLSLISGRASEFLIGKHVKAAPLLKATNLEVISTGYLLIESGNESAVERVTNTDPMLRNDVQKIVDTAIAGELLGMKLIYLEAGSGAAIPISEDIISRVKQNITIPLIVGGGIKNNSQLQNAFNAGADMVVIGTAIEDNLTFLNKLNG